MAGQRPDAPDVGWAELRRAAARDARRRAARLRRSAARAPRTRCAANLEAFRRWRIVPRMLRDVSRARPGARRCWARRCRRRCCSRRSACSRSSTPTASWPRARGRGRWACPMIASHRGVAHDGGGRRGVRRRPALVPALLAARRGAGGELRAPRRGGRLHGARRHARHLAAGLAPARPAAAPTCRSSRASASPTTSPTRSSASTLAAPPEEDPQAGGRAVRRRLLQPDGDLGRPRLAARADVAADRAQGHPAPRRRPPRARRAASTA